MTSGSSRMFKFSLKVAGSGWVEAAPLGDLTCGTRRGCEVELVYLDCFKYNVKIV